VKHIARRLFTWKFYFYEALLPTLATLPPPRADAVVRAAGRASAFLRPGRRARLKAAMDRVDALLKRDGGPASWRSLAESASRFAARDYPLDVASDPRALDRFDVRGFQDVQKILGRGQGAILVGSHLGAHIAGMHWLFRRGLPVRAMVQRPKHVSRELSRRFDSDASPFPQAEFFLKRDLAPADAVERMMRARAALREGLAVYLNGDIVWDGPNTRTCRLLGREHRFLAVWAELACLTGAPIVLVFCRHLAGGRFGIDFKPLDPAASARPERLLAAYLAEVEAQVALDPAEAVAYLTWPCYADAPEIAVPHSAPPRVAPVAPRTRRVKGAVST